MIFKRKYVISLYKEMVLLNIQYIKIDEYKVNCKGKVWLKYKCVTDDKDCKVVMMADDTLIAYTAGINILLRGFYKHYDDKSFLISIYARSEEEKDVDIDKASFIFEGARL